MTAATHREVVSCHSTGKGKPRYLRTHQVDCDSSTCRGCTPCPERHCRCCHRAHVTAEGRGPDLTCIDCLSETREHLHGIRREATRLFGEALLRGINSEAVMLAGPVADVEAWTHQALSALAGRIDPAWLDDCRDELHPLWVLGVWERVARRRLGQVLSPGSAQPTLTEAHDYLDLHLARLAHDHEFAFDAMADALKACHLHVEDVLYDGERDELGAPCPKCGGRNYLVKSYGETEKDDRWTCPRCHQWWTETDYRSKVEGAYVAYAPALTGSQIRETYRVPVGTIRSWAERGKVAKRGKDSQGRVLYDVAQVLAARDEHEARVKAAAEKAAKADTEQARQKAKAGQ